MIFKILSTKILLLLFPPGIQKNLFVKKFIETFAPQKFHQTFLQIAFLDFPVGVSKCNIFFGNIFKISKISEFFENYFQSTDKNFSDVQ